MTGGGRTTGRGRRPIDVPPQSRLELTETTWRLLCRLTKRLVRSRKRAQRDRICRTVGQVLQQPIETATAGAMSR